MNNVRDGIQTQFDAIAGAVYAPVAVRHHLGIDGVTTLRSPYLIWRLLSSALVRSESPDHLIGTIFRTLAGISDTQARTELERGLRESWAAWLCVLLLAPDPRIYWQRYLSFFPVASSDEALLRGIIEYLVLGEGPHLYAPETLPEEHRAKYSEPCASILLKLGLFLKSQGEDKGSSDSETATAWQRALQRPLRDHLDHITRGFAAQWQPFEDFVLALLYLTEWEATPDWYHVEELIRAYAAQPKECMTHEQLVLCCVLFGWRQGYRKLSAGIPEPAVRAHLSGQAMGLLSRRATSEGISELSETPAHFYANRDGLPGDPFAPLLESRLMAREQSLVLNETLNPRTGNMEVTSAERRTEETVEYRLPLEVVAPDVTIIHTSVTTLLTGVLPGG